MFIFGNFLNSVAQLLDIILKLATWLVIFRALISWVNPDPFNPIVQFLHRVTEPILEPIRRFVPARGVDFSPLIAVILIVFVRSFVIQSLLDLAWRLR